MNEISTNLHFFLDIKDITTDWYTEGPLCFSASDQTFFDAYIVKLCEIFLFHSLN